jgi:diphosphomevalonate decarboxylase
VEFDPTTKEDQLVVDNKIIESGSEFSGRVFRQIDRMRLKAGIKQKAIVHTLNTFPTGVGIASSASGFAALTVATSSALGLNLSEKDLSEMARLGSGSACRSIPNGFCEWIASDANNHSYAIQIAPPEHWDICIVTVVVSKHIKQLSSTSGHSLAVASPFFKTRLESLPQRLDKVRSAILERDFDTFGRETELEAISFHSIAMTSPIQTDHGWKSGAYYWLPDSLELMLAVQQWRSNGLNVYFTLDAGPSVHLICLNKDLDQVTKAVQEIEGRSGNDRKWDVMINKPAQGAHLISGQAYE